MLLVACSSSERTSSSGSYPNSLSGRLSAPPLANWQGERRAKAGLCGDTRLVGRRVDPIVGDGVCGILNPVEVTSVNGIAVSGKPVMDCATALSMTDWAAGPLANAMAGSGVSVTRINTIASYSCRTRNNRAGARISNHAVGRAVDISGFTVSSGRTLTVLNDWRSPLMQRLAAVSCGPFSTVLGPNYNAAHRDHLHFDVTLEYGGGTFCR